MACPPCLVLTLPEGPRLDQPEPPGRVGGVPASGGLSRRDLWPPCRAPGSARPGEVPGCPGGRATLAAGEQGRLPQTSGAEGLCPAAPRAAWGHSPTQTARHGPCLPVHHAWPRRPPWDLPCGRRVPGRGQKQPEGRGCPSRLPPETWRRSSGPALGVSSLFPLGGWLHVRECEGLNAGALSFLPEDRPDGEVGVGASQACCPSSLSFWPTPCSLPSTRAFLQNPPAPCVSVRAHCL